MNLPEIFRSLRIEFKTADESGDVRTGWIGTPCPFCGRGPDKFYLGWNLSHPRAHCWSCGNIPTVRALAELAGISWGRARAILGEVESDYSGPDKSELRGKFVPPDFVVPRILTPHRKYLRDRGLNWRVVEKVWGVGSIGLAAKLQWRLYIPIQYRGENVSWTTRAIGGERTRYISAPPECEKISARDILYGGDFVRHAAIVCEGPADCWAIGPGAVGLLGIGFSPAQVLRLSRIPLRYVCFDAEPAAQLRAKQLCDQLAPFPGTTQNILLETGKDPAAAGGRELRILRGLLG